MSAPPNTRRGPRKSFTRVTPKLEAEVKELLETTTLSHKAIAEKVGCSAATVSAIRYGRRTAKDREAFYGARKDEQEPSYPFKGIEAWAAPQDGQHLLSEANERLRLESTIPGLSRDRKLEILSGALRAVDQVSFFAGFILGTSNEVERDFAAFYVGRKL